MDEDVERERRRLPHVAGAAAGERRRAPTRARAPARALPPSAAARAAGTGARRDRPNPSVSPSARPRAARIPSSCPPSARPAPPSPSTRRRGGRRRGARHRPARRPTGPRSRGSRSGERPTPRASAPGSRTSTPRAAACGGRRCRTPRRAACPAVPRARGGSPRAHAGCGGARAPRARSIARSTSSSTSAGSTKRRPPWTTRWPTASAATKPSTSRDSSPRDEVKLEARGACVDHQDVRREGILVTDDELRVARRVLAGGELPRRSGRSTCSTTRCCASRCSPEHVKPRLLGPLGHDAGPELPLRAPEPRHPRARPRRDLRLRPGPRRPGRRRARRTSRGRTASSIRTSRGTRTGCARCSGSSRSPAGSRATRRPRRPARSTRAASSATRSSHAYGAAFDDPDLIVACVVGDGEAETGPLATSWHSNKFSSPERRARSCRSSTSTATRSRTRPCSPGSREDELASLMRGYGYAPLLLRPARPDDVHLRCRDPTAAIAEIRSTRRRSTTARADDRASARPRAGPARARSTGCRSRAPGGRTRCRSPRCGRTPSTSPSSRTGCGATGRTSCSTTSGALRTEIAALAPAGERRMAATRTPNGGLLLRDLELPDFRDFAVAVDEPRRRRSAEATRVLGELADARSCGANPRQLPHLRPRRDGLEPARCRLRGDRQAVGCGARADRRAPRAERARRWRCSRSTSARAGSRATS